jgi:hypothetical protein
MYKDKSSDIRKWLSKFFGLPFLSHDEVENSFVEDIIFDAPNDDKCSKFADYVLENYIMDTSSFPPCIWASIPDQNCSRTNNGPERFHGHFNAQFYARHPNIFIFLDVLKQIQTSTYIKIRSLDTPALQRRTEVDKINFSVDKYQTHLHFLSGIQVLRKNRHVNASNFHVYQC